MSKVISKTVTPIFRVSFPFVFEPSAAPGSTKKKYSVVAIFDQKELAKPENKALFDKMQALLKDAAVKKWGDKVGADLKKPWRDGAEENKKDKPGYGAGKIWVTLSSNKRPGLVDGLRQVILDPNNFYPGCYARATVNAYAWEFMGKKGVSFGLQNIQKTGDGEPLGGRGNPEMDFDVFEGASADTEAPSSVDSLFN